MPCRLELQPHSTGEIEPLVTPVWTPRMISSRVNSGGQTVQTVTEVRHVDLVRLALFVIGVGLHVDEVDVGLNLLIFNIWNNDRTYCRTEGSFQFFKDLVKVGVLHIQLADKEHGRLGGVLGHLVGLLGADVDAGLAGYGDEQALHGARAFSGHAGKVE